MKCPVRFMAGSTTSVEPQLRCNWNQSGRNRNQIYRDQTTAVYNLWSIPLAYVPPYTWMLPYKVGYMSAHDTTTFGIATNAAQIYGGITADAPATFGISTNTPSGELVSTVQPGDAPASFGISTNAAIMTGAISAAFEPPNSNFSISILNSTAGALNGAGVTITMSLTPVATATASASASATISGQGEAVTPETVANAVWEAFSVSHDNPGTMGEAMNAAGSAADPWLTVLPGAYLAGTAGQIIGSLESNINTHTDSAVATQQSLLELSSFENVVHIDTVDGAAGTAYPLGTHDHPVDNMIDALAIAFTNGFGSIMVKNALTILASNAIDNFTITSDSWPAVTLNAGVPMENTIFKRVSLYGEFGGFWNILDDCWTYDITNFSGWVRGGSIGKVALSVGLGVEFGGQSFFDNIVPLFPGVPSEITANTNSEISITNSTDLVLLKSMTTGCVAYISLSGGTITIDASCTGGTIVVSGVGTFVNNSALPVAISGLAATLDTLNADPVAVNTTKMNGIEIIGTGVSADKWRGVGEPA